MPVPHYSTLGDGPLVLFLHGIGGGHLAFAPQLESFAAAGYRAVAWDAPGYGSSAPIEPYTFKALAMSCIALIENLAANKQPITLVGHSMGGMVAQEVVARRPDLVGRLVLSGTSASFGKPDGAWQSRFIAERCAPLDAGQSMAQLAEFLVPTMVGSGHLPEGVQLAVHCMGQVHAATYRRALQALVTFDRKASLAAIACPTLLIAGEQDKNAPPAVMQRMAALIAQADYAELKGIGHLANLEAPDEFDALVLNFLRLPSMLNHNPSNLLH
jgi:3-oxoadipate enol-lactonase